jgi:hypothetical protein
MGWVMGLDMSTVISTVIGALISIIASWFFSRLFYKKAGDDLRNEAKELRRLNAMILRAMEIAGWVKINRDERGEPIGFIFELQASAGEIKISGADATLEVRRNLQSQGKHGKE